MTNASVAILALTLASCLMAAGQEGESAGGKQSLGVTSSYSPTSSHIFIGTAEQRRTFTAGIEYTRRLWEWNSARFDYAGEFSPLFRESDPTLVAGETMLAGSNVIIPISPTRVVEVSHAPIGCSCVSTCNPIYPVYGHDETTFAVAVSPVGARVILARRHRLQPTFETGLGVVLSGRDLPVDNAASINYEFSFGPGVQVFASRSAAVRLEYVFRHISNANSGTLNPGIDQGVFRLTLSKYH